MNKYYVYAHATNDGEIFYIGKGSGRRCHQTGNRSVYWKRIRKKYGFNPIILSDFLDEEQAFAEEIKFISIYKKAGKCRANFTLGGDGVRVENRWWNKKISEGLKGMKRPRGKDSPSYKDKISREELYELYVEKGLNTVEISRKYGLSTPTVVSRLRKYNIKVRGAGQPKKKVKCTNDGRVFKSISDAAKHYQLFRENIRKVLNGKYNHTGNKRFAYVNR